jgi:hypothetical protein
MVRIAAIAATVGLFVLSAALGGCSTTLALNSVPASALARAELSGFSRIRIWGDATSAELSAFLEVPAPRPLSLASGNVSGDPNRIGQPNPPSYLALSSGGSDGAYGAGVLIGWTDSGQRPEFSIVTGVSTGALTAPFAFLGSAYDIQLREIYTNYSTTDLGSPRPFSVLLGGPSLVDNQGFQSLLARYVDERTLAAIAREHHRGRRLLVTTTNLETERQVIWNLGAIAASRQHGSLDLFRRVLLASAAVPGVFPPVVINVAAGGRNYEELHADGGTVGQVFFVAKALPNTTGPRGTLYVIRNGMMSSRWQAIEPTTIGIASRSISTLIKSQARGDVERLYTAVTRSGVNFRLAAIPGDFSAKSTEPFDIGYMRQLFALGYRRARAGYRWAKAPV